MKNCIDCQFSRERPYGLACMSPDAATTGRLTTWHRSLGWFKAWWFGACGKSGRWYNGQTFWDELAGYTMKPGSLTQVVDGQNIILARSPLRDNLGRPMPERDPVTKQFVKRRAF